MSEFAINYRFFPGPQVIKNKMRFAPLTGNEYKVMDTIVDLITAWPDTRQDFQKELSGSYIAQNIKLSESAIYRAITGLIRKGFLSVVNEARKGVGRVLKILHNDLQFSHTISGNNEIKQSIKKNNNTVDVSSIKNKDNSPPAALDEAHSDTPMSKNIPESEKFSEYLQAAPAAVLPHTVRNGIKFLKRRKVTDFLSAIIAIKEEMSKRPGIDNIQGYFTALCKDFDLQDSSQSSSSGSSSPLAPTRHEAEELYKKRKQHIEKTANQEVKQDDAITQEESLIDHWQDLQEQYPDKTEQVKKKVDNSPMGRRAFVEILKIPLYLEEFSKLNVLC